MRRGKNLPHHIEFARAMQHTPAPVDAISFPPLRRPALTALVLVVAAMHTAVLWLLMIATKPHGRIAGTAERIVVELRDRVDGIAQTLPGMHGSVAKDPVAEASSALQQLGYRPVEVARLIKEVAEAGDSAEGIIRKALKAALR